MDYTQNIRGFNVCVFNSDDIQLIDSVHFDLRDTAVTTRNDKSIDLSVDDRTTQSLVSTEKYLTEKFFMSYALLKGSPSLEQAKIDYFMGMERPTGKPYLRNMMKLFVLNKMSLICDKLDLKYWLDFWSLIGALRHYTLGR